MTVYDALDIRKSDACALELLCPVQALKKSEELVLVPHIKAHSVIFYAENIFFAGVLRRDLYYGR